MKRRLIITAAVCAAVLLIASLASGYWNNSTRIGRIRVGFIYSEDESTPYTANFVQAQNALKEEYGDKVEILFRSNVPSRDCEQPMRELANAGCRVIFINMDTYFPV